MSDSLTLADLLLWSRMLKGLRDPRQMVDESLGIFNCCTEPCFRTLWLHGVEETKPSQPLHANRLHSRSWVGPFDHLEVSSPSLAYPTRRSLTYQEPECSCQPWLCCS